MDDALAFLQRLFQFFDNMIIAGLSLNTWVVILIVVGGLALLIRGNKS